MGSGLSCEYPFGTIVSFNPLYDDFCHPEKVEIERDEEVIVLRTLESPFKTLQLDTDTGQMFFGNEHIGYQLDRYDMEFSLNKSSIV